jgi:CHAT domain-containing protein
METVPRSCPDPEALAAWLDQGVDAAEGEQIEAHLATCDDCRLVIARVLETQSAVRETRAAGTVASVTAPMRVARFPRKRIVWGGASVLAAAAVMMLSLDTPLRWPWSASGTASKLADLAAAVGDERTVEARLTGGFSYGPLHAAVRSGGGSAALDNWMLFAAAGKIREDAAREPTAANLHALGVAYLVLGEADAAVRAFEDAIAEAPEHARYHSDLAAAYLARARQLDYPDDFPRAIDAAERALKADDALLEARFNRALALEALFLNDQARAAWDDYLSRDASSGWASEARAHWQKLQPAPSPGDLGRNNSPPPIDETSVEAALDWLLRQGLPQWAEAVLANDIDRAAREHLRLTEYATRITDLSGDRFALALLEEGGQPRRERAQALRGVAAALAAHAANDTSAADAAFATACVDADPPIAVLCDANRGALDVLQRRDADAERRASTAMRIATDRQWIYPANLAKLLAGYRMLFKGNYAAAVAPYAEAFDGFHDAKYLGAACNLALQLADLADVVGLSDDGWRWRRRALELAARSGAPSCVYLTRLQSADALVEQHLVAAASIIVRGLDSAAIPHLSDLRRAALGVVKGRIALAADERARLRDTLELALTMVEQSADFRARRLAPDLLVLQGKLQHREGQLDSAQQALTRAIESMGPERIANRAAALLARARVAADQLENHAGAERDVRHALQLLESRLANAPVQPLRLEEASLVFQTLASMVTSRDALKGSRGLWLVERMRQVLNGAPAFGSLTEAALDTEATRLPPDSVVVSYLLASNSIIAWVGTSTGWQFVERSVRAEDITRLLNTLTVQIQRNPARDDLWRPTLSELHELLVRGLPGVVGAREIIVIPDGLLNRVPFSALFDTQSNQYLFERAAVRVSPNLAFAIHHAARAQAPTSAAVVGDPRLSGAAAGRFRPLPRVRAEALGVASLYRKATVILGDDATKSRVLAALNQADVVHYAGHAIAMADRQGARLLLTGDVSDPLTGLAPGDLVGHLTRPVRVVLAACETGATSTDRAAGLSSLSTALLRAGAVSVVATLWPVDDSASEMFFSNIHRALAAGQRTATAVARAQLACRADAACRRAAGVWIGTQVYGSN